MVATLRGESRYHLRAQKHRFVRHGVVGVKVRRQQRRRVVLRVVIVPDVVPEVVPEVVPVVQEQEVIPEVQQQVQQNPIVLTPLQQILHEYENAFERMAEGINAHELRFGRRQEVVPVVQQVQQQVLVIPAVPAEVIPEVQAIEQQIAALPVAGPRVSRYDVSLMYLLTKPTALHGQMMYAFEGYTAIELYEIGRQLAVEYNQQNLNSPLGFLMGKYEDQLQYHCFNNCSVIVHYFKRFVH